MQYHAVWQFDRAVLRSVLSFRDAIIYFLLSYLHLLLMIKAVESKHISTKISCWSIWDEHWTSMTNYHQIIPSLFYLFVFVFIFVFLYIFMPRCPFDVNTHDKLPRYIPTAPPTITTVLRMSKHNLVSFQNVNSPLKTSFAEGSLRP